MLLPNFGWCYSQVWQILLSTYRLMLLPKYYYWLMLLPLADVTANCVEDVKPQALNFCNKCEGWCYYLVADGMATAGWLGRCYCIRCYFNFSSEVLRRTSSHMWGRWYLPMWFWHLPLLAITSAIIHNMMNKNIFPYTLWCIKICRENIFFRLEEAHSGEQKLVSL